MGNLATAKKMVGRDRTDERREELKLLSGLLTGDSHSGRSFFQRYNSVIELKVRRVLWRYRGKIAEDDVQDMVQSIWISLLENDMQPLRRFNPGRKIKVSTWIGLLARNKTIDKLRCSRSGTSSLDDLNPVNEPLCPNPLPSDVVETSERKTMAGRAMQQLSKAECRFMEAWYVDERAPEKIANELGVAVNTVYSRRFKIQAKLGSAVRRLNRPGSTWSMAS